MTTADDRRSPRPQVALVTGANKGIGCAIAAGLLGESFVVYLGARDTYRGTTAAKELRSARDFAREEWPPSGAVRLMS